MANVAETFKKWLTGATKKRGAQAAILKKTGISPSLLRAYRLGTSEPGIAKAEEICRAMGTSLAEVLGKRGHDDRDCLERVHYILENVDDFPDLKMRLGDLFLRAISRR